MPKLKTRRAAAKRFSTTGTGKIKRMKPYKATFWNLNPRNVNVI